VQQQLAGLQKMASKFYDEKGKYQGVVVERRETLQGDTAPKRFNNAI
jgi:hypothetical protein